MTIHYQNELGESAFLPGVVHMQNIDDETFELLLEDDSMRTLAVCQIEGIYCGNR